MKTQVTPIILCGGGGTRLLPFLKYKHPKQFLNIIKSHRNLLQNTLLRFNDKDRFKKPIIVANISHRKLVEKSIEEVSMGVGVALFEAEGRNTGPAIASVISYLKELGFDEDTVLLVVPIDHYIKSKKKFLLRVDEAVKAIRSIDYQEKNLDFFCEKDRSRRKLWPSKDWQATANCQPW